MAITVRIPTPLQRLTNGQGEVACEGTTVTELLSDLERRHPGIKERICDEEGKLRRFVNIFVNDEDIRFMQGDQTQIKDGDEVSIIPAIAGGSAEGAVQPLREEMGAGRGNVVSSSRMNVQFPEASWNLPLRKGETRAPRSDDREERPLEGRVTVGGQLPPNDVAPF